ncbi:MAG: hypothetical protein QHH14_00840 [Clostridiales bacterium]|nr:hypothetical protein [Clostridiales bacterium]
MKKVRYPARNFLLCFFVLALVSCRSFTTYVMESLPPGPKIVIDGNTDDWRGALSIIEDGNVSLGFFNDQEYLYICLIAEDDVRRAQMMMQGLTVWFDPLGGKDKALGIRYPLGMSPGERPMRPRGEWGGIPAEDFSEEVLAELEIITSTKEASRKIRVEEAKGIEVKAVPASGLLVYELKIPLLQSGEQPFAVGAQPGKKIGVGFETGKLDPGLVRGRSPGGMRPGGGGFGPGGGRMGGFGQMPEIPEALKIWAQVQLSSGKRGDVRGAGGWSSKERSR